ncbi:MAG: biotin-dependent carboxyltransferase family protein [Desulfohalobiaceae bacterium]|nr:biotin-dependent carboxyltransferase family protein [Desulfohalobiaceae bacterium]
MKSFKIIHPGMYTSFQDLGRPEVAKYGLPASGAMDQLSMVLANLLVGNQARCTVLETALQGLRILAHNPIQIAITGADQNPHVDKAPVPNYTALTLNAGQELFFRNIQQGCWSYIAFAGGIHSTEFLGSCSVYPSAEMGRPLEKGQCVEVLEQDDGKRRRAFSLPISYRGDVLDEQKAFRVLPGPQLDHFSKEGIETFYGKNYIVSPQCNRQACRMDGPPIALQKEPGIITDPTPPGSIQVPGDQKPIILLRDGQVTGGYAKIGILSKVDLNRLSQLRPGKKIQFVEITRKQAVELFREQKRLIQRAKSYIQDL